MIIILIPVRVQTSFCYSRCKIQNVLESCPAITIDKWGAERRSLTRWVFLIHFTVKIRWFRRLIFSFLKSKDTFFGKILSTFNFTLNYFASSIYTFFWLKSLIAFTFWSSELVTGYVEVMFFLAPPPMSPELLPGNVS